MKKLFNLITCGTFIRIVSAAANMQPLVCSHAACIHAVPVLSIGNFANIQQLVCSTYTYSHALLMGFVHS